MSKRRQIRPSDRELRKICEFADRQRPEVEERARPALPGITASRHLSNPATKVKAVTRAAEFSFPVSDIDRMLGEIEQGYDYR